MWRARIAVGLVAAGAAWTPGISAGAGNERLRLTASGDELGWVSLAVDGPQRGTVIVRELTGGGPVTVARLSLRAGSAARVQGVRWRCSGRTRRFTARLRVPGKLTQTASASITTPSCAFRLRMIVVPARLRPGESASVRITDTWRLGGIDTQVCARPDGEHTRCTAARLAAGARTARSRVRLSAKGHRAIVLRSEFGQRLEAQVHVRDDARLRVLVTGDSMIFGLFETLASDLGARGSVLGDPHPGRGITTPGGFLDWPAHARRSARTDRPDVTVVLLGAADAGYPLVTATGETVACCEPGWVGEYARRVGEMMASYLREGRGLVYWILLPAPRSATKAPVTQAENAAVRIAGRAFDDGVRVIARIADTLSPEGRYRESIHWDGRLQVVRDDDGVHLTALGIRIATDIVRETLRTDGLVD